MRASLVCAFGLILSVPLVFGQSPTPLNVSISASGKIASDKVAWFYPTPNIDASGVLLVGNDGAATGGFDIWKVISASNDTLSSPIVHKTGRTKLIHIVYSIAGKDWITTLAQSDSFLRLFDVETHSELESARTKVWGDYSAMCGWRAPSGAQYIYIFGKKAVKVYLLQDGSDRVNVLEVFTAPVPIEAEGCTVSQNSSAVLFASGDGNVYAFKAAESSESPSIKVLFSTGEAISGLTTYYGLYEEHLLVLFAHHINIYDDMYTIVRRVEIAGVGDYELNDIAIYQGVIGPKFPSGAIAYAIESDELIGFGISSLESVFSDLDLTLAFAPNTAFTPRDFVCDNCTAPTCESLDNCSGSGFCPSRACARSRAFETCRCFAGFAGENCAEITCADNCSGHGTCEGPNTCVCEDGWAGPTCAFQIVYAKYETEENGEDGDDPAVWISPSNPGLSRVITTTKSSAGAGLAVFDLTGKKHQHYPIGEPNNVDVIYGLKLGNNRTVDLAFAACREDNTLCLAEITSNGTLVDITGGIQPTPDNYEVYGSCSYHSTVTGKYYLFVNAKNAQYLQYELSSSSNGNLTTTLIRSFRGGSGGQVEGCVADDENGWIFISEEPYGLWRYSAEPHVGLQPGAEDESATGTLVDSVDGHLFADVEGVTLLYGPTPTKGLILVSCQGMSAYNVYKRSPPHEFVKHFTISTTKDGKIDRVTNTDGITAVGNALGPDFPRGLIITHDDVNEAPYGSVSEEAAFKLVSLADLLDDDLLQEVDTTWDPRS